MSITAVIREIEPLTVVDGIGDDTALFVKLADRTGAGTVVQFTATRDNMPEVDIEVPIDFVLPLALKLLQAYADHDSEHRHHPTETCEGCASELPGGQRYFCEECYTAAAAGF